MLGRLTYGIILAALFLCFSSTSCYAPTDWIVNTVDFANGLVKDASSVQEEYANYANNYLQSKIGSFGDFNSLVKSQTKLEKIQERYKTAQARYEKAKALAAKVTEKKAVLQERANKLKETADKIKAEYEEEKKKIEEIKNEAQKAKKELEEATEKASELKDLTVESVDTIKEKSGMLSEDKNNTTTDVSQNVDMTKQEVPVAASIIQDTSKSAQNQTLINIEALATEDKGITTDVSLSVAPSTNLMTTISAEEVVKASEEPEERTLQHPEAVSQFNLKEQILMSDRTVLNPQKESGLETVEIEGSLKKPFQGSSRQSFKAIQGVTEEAANE